MRRRFTEAGGSRGGGGLGGSRGDHGGDHGRSLGRGEERNTGDQFQSRKCLWISRCLLYFSPGAVPACCSRREAGSIYGFFINFSALPGQPGAAETVDTWHHIPHRAFMNDLGINNDLAYI